MAMESQSHSVKFTLTVRLIRSFEQRNIKHVVYHDVNLNQITKTFIDCLLCELKTKAGLPPPFRNYGFDTLKISHQPHGSKTNDPVINTENDELILDESKTLKENGVGNETELSFFKKEDYLKYKENPHLAW